MSVTMVGRKQEEGADWEERGLTFGCSGGMCRADPEGGCNTNGR